MPSPAVKLVRQLMHERYGPDVRVQCCTMHEDGSHKCLHRVVVPDAGRHRYLGVRQVALLAELASELNVSEACIRAAARG